MSFYAHSHQNHPSPGPKWQPLAAHLVSVGTKARGFLTGSLPNDYKRLAEMAGLLHDLGKYRPEFQQMLCGLSPPREKTYHKQAGAAKAAIDLQCIPVAFAIAGHHGGLPNKTDLGSAVMSPNGLAVAREVWNDAVGDLPELANLTPLPVKLEKLQAELLTRLIFSSLVDADWTDTAAHERSANGLPPDAPPADFKGQQWLAALLEHLLTKSENCTQESVKACRKDVLDACLAAAEIRSCGVYN